MRDENEPTENGLKSMVKRTGPTSGLIRYTAKHLHKHAQASKKSVFDVLSEAILTSTRIRAEVNVEKLEKIWQTSKGKVLVVPGKILSKGTLNTPIEVAALRYSVGAKEKILSAKGKAHTLDELIHLNIPASKLMVVK